MFSLLARRRGDNTSDGPRLKEIWFGNDEVERARVLTGSLAGTVARLQWENNPAAKFIRVPPARELSAFPLFPSS